MHRTVNFPRWKQLKVRAAFALSIVLIALCFFNGNFHAAAQVPVSAIPPASTKKVAFTSDIKPILTAKCYGCHGNGARQGGLTLDSRDKLLQGGTSGPAAIAGNSAQSRLIQYASGLIPGKIMPPNGARLTAGEIGILRTWIDQGMKFGDPGASGWTAPLLPRRLKLPPAAPGSGLTNPIDRILQPYFKAHKIAPVALVDDRTYARRVSLDLIGLLPTPAQMQAFLADRRPDKRTRLVEALLADDTNYADHWLTFWNDLLRNDYAGTGYIDGGRTQITEWLYHALRTNLPYDRFVSQLVNPTPQSAGFINGIVWRGVVNASQTPQMQAAQNIGQVFMGVNLKCASCHNSFINAWKLADCYGMASIYTEKPLELVRCDKPTGEVAAIKFMYPELGTIDGNAPRAERLQQLSAAITNRNNGRLARTLVNRLWAKLMGRGMVEPTDEMDNKPWDPDLLDWLAADFADNGYDMKCVLEEIATSRAYQLPARGLRSERVTDFVFAGPTVKRMNAEQFADAISTLTGVWPIPAPAFQSPNLAALDSSHEVKFKSGILRSGSAAIDIDITGARVLTLIATDGGDNNHYDWADWIEPTVSGPQGEVKLTSLKWRTATTGYGEIKIGQSIVGKPLRLENKTYADGIGTHANSVMVYDLPPGMTRFRTLAGPDAGSVEQPSSTVSMGFYVLAGEPKTDLPRAALAFADPLLVALGRPNREQVVTERSPAATTLQALELTNGPTLASRIEQGARHWMSDTKRTPTGLVNILYATTLNRLSTTAELQTALQIVGAPVQKEGVEDLLWILVMLPEFQLIY